MIKKSGDGLTIFQLTKALFSVTIQYKDTDERIGKGYCRMKERTVSKERREEYKKQVLQEFKSAVNFYRLESSEDLIGLFNTFGYLLICGITGEGGIRELRETNYASAEELEKIQARIRYEETERWAYLLDDNRALAETVRKIRQYTIPNGITISVWNNIMAVLQTTLECYQEVCDPAFLYETVRSMFDLCVNTKTDLNRYTLPDYIVLQLVKLLQSEPAGNEGREKLRIFDPQYGSGNMLLMVGNYLKNAHLCGFEQDARFRMSARILSVLANQVIETWDGKFLENREIGSFDIVITNPLFSSESVWEEDRAWFVPGELGRVRGRHNLFLVRSMQLLTENGQAVLVVPDSFLFSTKAETMDVRRWLLNTYCVEGIISLPAKVFYPSTMTNASVLIVSNPFMRVERISGKTPYLFFYQMNVQEDTEQTDIQLMEIWNQRDYYFDKWQRQMQADYRRFGGVPTPEKWEHENFWFADMEVVAGEKWSLLPKNYKPDGRTELQAEDPRALLEELIREQEGLLKEMRQFAEEVERL